MEDSGMRAQRKWLVGCWSAILAIGLPGVAAGATRVGEPGRNPSGRLPLWDNYSDTWVATDGLGRTLPTYHESGPPRAGKHVGIFYFLWLGQHGETGPFDISKILASQPDAMQDPHHPLWGPLHAPHHWGESVFGYYVSDDEGVLAKHAQMLADAKVDVVIFDVTNQLTYRDCYLALCRVWDRIRQNGGCTPQIAFLCPLWKPKKVVHELYDDFYGPGRYSDLWFQWGGKPLILADPEGLGEIVGNEQHDSAVELRQGQTLGQSFSTDAPFDAVGGCFPTWMTTTAAMTLTLRQGGPSGKPIASERFVDVPDNAWLSLRLTNSLPAGTYFLQISDPAGKVGWWSHTRDRFPEGQAFRDQRPALGDRTLRISLTSERSARLRRFFTFRKPQPDYFAGPRRAGEWGWLEVHPQHAFYQTPGVPEQVAVGVAQNAVDGRLSVLSNLRSRGRSFHEGEQPAPAGQDFTGRNFAEQWHRALELDPAFIFITGWNEWIAGRFTTNSGFYGDGPVTFVDEFDREYSRDIEPMEGGHEDSYYYQMVAHIRRFKGVRPLEPVSSNPIRIDGRFEDWVKVKPEFRDSVGDPVQRDHPGWGKAGRYVNRTGRNDIIIAKVSGDDHNLWFYVRTREPLTSCADSNWMLLFIDGDQNPTNGWLGYDYVVNRTGVSKERTTLERHVGRGYRWGHPVGIEHRAAGTELELAIPRVALDLPGQSVVVDFKWADNLRQNGEASDLTLNGDAAPNDRFNFRALLRLQSETSPMEIRGVTK